MRRSQIPSPPTAEDILGARLRHVQKQLEGLTTDGTVTTPGGGTIPGPKGTPGADGGCADLDLVRDLETIDTGMTRCYTVRAFNEYVYVAGFDDPNPKLKIYRYKQDGSFVHLSSLTLSQEIRRFVLHGRYIFGCKDDAGGHNLISVKVHDPWNPEELDQIDVGFAASGLDAQGRYVWVVGGSSSGEIQAVDVIDPSAMALVV